MGGFQSPYGDFGTLTLPPGTRSQTGLTGDFFKPPAFFVFFGDPGEKQKSGSAVYRLGYAIFHGFKNFQTYGVFGPEIGFPKVSRTLTYLKYTFFDFYCQTNFGKGLIFECPRKCLSSGTGAPSPS